MKKRRHILCFVAWWPDEEQFTGVFIKEHIKAISLYHDVEVIHVRYFKTGLSLPRTTISSTLEEGSPIHRINISTPLRRFGFLDRMIKTAYLTTIKNLTLSRPFDMIHVHVLDQTTKHASEIAEILDLPIVLTEHFSFYHTGINLLPPKEQQAQRQAIRLWLQNQRLKLVMPVSKDLGNVLVRDYGLAEEKLAVVPNIASHVFRPGNGKPDQPPFKLFLLAIWRPPKDHHVFIEALKLIPAEVTQHWEIVWGGYGPDLNTIIKRCSHEIPFIYIRFPGYMEKDEIASELQSAHSFVLPTTAENLPCVILESLCTGTPVISMSVNGIPEVVNHRNGILVPPSDAKALADALVEMASGKIRFDHGAIAKEAVSKFSEEAISSLIDEAYHKIGP